MVDRFTLLVCRDELHPLICRTRGVQGLLPIRLEADQPRSHRVSLHELMGHIVVAAHRLRATPEASLFRRLSKCCHYLRF